MPTPLWDFWLKVSSSDLEQGWVQTDYGQGEHLSYHLHNSNPWPERGITVAALPAEGFRFDGWFENDTLVTTESPYTFMGRHAQLIAKFSPETE